MPAAARIVVTSGEPAGIGPDLCLRMAQRDWPCELVFAGDPELFRERARLLGTEIELAEYDRANAAAPHRRGRMLIGGVSLAEPVVAGRLDPRNAPYVLELIDRAVAGCQRGEFAALVTAPVQKSVLLDAGIAFTGHTEYLAERTSTPRPVMLLVAGRLRVALATTHLPLSEVSAALSTAGLESVLQVIHDSLRARFGIDRPRITVCGLNPHAGESGHLGREEIEIIAPAVENMRRRGLDVTGPVPADTAFTPRSLAGADVVLAMYHDQGLPVLKFAGFGEAVNITLGLPIIRTSVDHGTALTLAGTGQIEDGSLAAAITQALAMVRVSG